MEKAPKTIFIPSKAIQRRIIKACIVFGKLEPKEAFFMRFGLLDNHFELLHKPKQKKRLGVTNK